MERDNEAQRATSKDGRQSCMDGYCWLGCCCRRSLDLLLCTHENNNKANSSTAVAAAVLLYCVSSVSAVDHHRWFALFFRHWNCDTPRVSVHITFPAVTAH